MLAILSLVICLFICMICPCLVGVSNVIRTMDNFFLLDRMKDRTFELMGKHIGGPTDRQFDIKEGQFVLFGKYDLG